LDTYSINPVVVRMKESEKGVVYQSIVALSMRARQINDQIHAETMAQLDEVRIDTDSDVINYDQIAVSKKFDELLKPTFFAMKEILNDKLHIEMREEDIQNTENEEI